MPNALAVIIFWLYSASTMVGALTPVGLLATLARMPTPMMPSMGYAVKSAETAVDKPNVMGNVFPIKVTSSVATTPLTLPDP